MRRAFGRALGRQIETREELTATIGKQSGI